MKYFSKSSNTAFAVAIALCFSKAGTNAADPSAYQTWAAGHGLAGAGSHPESNPDGDRFPNALEFAFGTDPLSADNPSEVAPGLELSGSGAQYRHRASKARGEGVTFQVLQSTDLKNWKPVGVEPTIEPGDESADVMVYQVADSKERFYKLSVSVLSSLGVTSIEVGSNVGSAWDGLPVIPTVKILTQPPAVSGNITTPNLTKYPEVAGASQGAFTQDLIADYKARPGTRPPLRTWLGWFLWGKGEPPEGINPGIFTTEAGYGTYNGTTHDYFNYQYQKTAGKGNGTWNPVRVDQQPLYLTPLTLNYNWAPGLFGYNEKPFLNFPDPSGLFYWREKSIVRGVNISGTAPFFYQYGNKNDLIPAPWQQAFMYVSSRPLENTVIVPGNLTADKMLNDGPWNNLGGTDNNKFPYPVFDTTVDAAQQTPFAILADKIGDFHADLVYEAANPRSGAYYETNRYGRTAFNQAGKGNYLKMTVAQGSPYVWCETNNASTVNFYNLIRANLPDSLNNNKHTNARVLSDGPYSVPGVSDVKFVLLYGNQLNPNQPYQETMPFNANLGGDPTQNDQSPGGFNPPAVEYLAKDGSKITPKGQSNHVYTAIFYRDSAVKPIQAGKFGKNVGTDANGNPYFYMEFLKPGKNWFVVAQLPEMRYYHTEVAEDPEEGRKQAAMAVANELGKYAFNFMTSSSVTYQVTGMWKVDTNYNFQLTNPFVAAGDAKAKGLSVPGQTVLSLAPHQYQPITLGPDLTKKTQPEVVWNPLKSGYGTDLPLQSASASIPNANKTNPTTPSRWGYWSLRGNLKAIVTGGFATTYPFQNFLPLMPPADMNRTFQQTGVAAINITNPGTGNTNSYPQPTVTIDGFGKGSGATFDALVDPRTGGILVINVVTRGSGYPVTPGPGDPSGTIVKVTVSDPVGQGGRTAKAYAQTSGEGEVLAIFLLDRGTGYAPVLSVTQEGSTIDPPIVVPSFSLNGTLQAGPAIIQDAGAGFDFSKPITISYFGNGATMPTATAVQPGTLGSVAIAPYIGNRGRYLGTGSPPAIQANVPPPNGNSTQNATVSLEKMTGDYQPVVTNPGLYTEKPTASFVDDDGKTIDLIVIFPDPPPPGGAGIALGNNGSATLNSPKDITISGGNATTPAKGRVYPTYNLVDGSPVALSNPLAVGYDSNVQLSFTGGTFSDDPAVTVPEIGVTIPANGVITADNLSIIHPGAGLPEQSNTGSTLQIVGGSGFSAILLPLVSPITGNGTAGGEILAVRVIEGGSNYLPEGSVYAYIVDTTNKGKDAVLNVRINNGTVTAVDVVDGGTLYPPSISLFLTSKKPPFGANLDTDFNYNPKGLPARFLTKITAGKVTGFLPVAGQPDSPPPMKYIPGSFGKVLQTTGPAFVSWLAPAPFATPTALATGYIATPAPQSTQVGQIFYSSIIYQYTQYAGKNLAPFNGSFLGNSALDGYGLGGQLGASGKFLGDIFNVQQTLGDQPSATPTSWALSEGTKPASSYDQPVFALNNPIISLDSGLKSSVQGLQRAISLLFLDPPSKNNPPGNSTNTWELEYFAQYDEGVGRLVINPSGGQPVEGVLSSIPNPPDMPDTAGNNLGKTGLSQWQKGMLWSGFGVSDQWNDQHYFYGYYLSSAALAGIFDYAWLNPVPPRPANPWSGPAQMGTAIDQMILTLAADPDNAAFTNALYKNESFSYQKMAFFDQWSGHPWASGAQPGSTSAVLDFQTS